MPPTDSLKLLEAASSGDRRALARSITIVEEGREGARRLLAAAYPKDSFAYRVGLTGAPGAGKSTIADRMIELIRRSGDEVAVLAVDPTSPFSGGAVLGDRVRMQDHILDAGVYIRSMASRGHLGGLSVAAPKALAVMAAAGFPYLLLETVGVGQDEVEVAAAADTVVVVVNPGWGDGIQAAKAGILEIGDVFAVNKADRSGTDETVADLRSMLSLGTHDGWVPPIVATEATVGTGVEDLLVAVREHRAYLEETGLEASRHRRRQGELETAVVEHLRSAARQLVHSETPSPDVEAVLAGKLDPWTAAERIAGSAGA